MTSGPPASHVSNPFFASGEQNDFRRDVFEGLARAHKAIPCKYFYDERGIELFDAICHTPEYYPTRTEMSLLKKHAKDIGALAGPGVNVIEFGTGSSAKAELLLSGIDTPASYIPVDIASASLANEAAAMSQRYPDLTVAPVFADFTLPFALPSVAAQGRRLGFFPGSTIGNFTPEEAGAFFHRCARLLGQDGVLVVGVDLKKSKRILDDAYNDAAGLTAAFNLNLLHRINRELKANFDLDSFTHCAHYNLVRGRVEMHIYSLSFQTVRIDGRLFSFIPGESIHTENSYKYSVPEFEALAQASGFITLETWVDADHLFSLHVLRVAHQ
ncbi:MAG: L-histidine N(alpha)-methyltransferase [Rhodospirillaceae bacterium]|nr:L-histidine N(alpha)-methyltransferase [Rhodospirillaceae bacterium]